jgi:hypothetical protein
LTNKEFCDKNIPELNEAVLEKMKIEFENAMIRLHSQQYEQIFEATTGTLNTTLQGIVNAAAQL